jgi:alcohol dehydrogenase, propanol-preferring
VKASVLDRIAPIGTSPLSLRSVTANTRADGQVLLREAAEIPLRPKITLFPLEEANRALPMPKADRISGSGVLVVNER